MHPLLSAKVLLRGSFLFTLSLISYIFPANLTSLATDWDRFAVANESDLAQRPSSQLQQSESMRIIIDQNGVKRSANTEGYINVKVGEPYRIEIYTPNYVSAVIIKIDGVPITGTNVGKRLLCIYTCGLERPFSVAKKFIVLTEGNPGLGKDGGVNNPDLGLIEVTFMPMRKRAIAQNTPQSSSRSYIRRTATPGNTIRPTDWEYTSLQLLVERYGCISGFPNNSNAKQQVLTRYQFAAGLQNCLDKMNEIIAAGLRDKVDDDDIRLLQKLQEEFAAELASSRGRVDALEARTTPLESQQLSTTTKLNASPIIIPQPGAVPPQTRVAPPQTRVTPVGTGLSGESSQRFIVSTEWIDAPEIAPVVTKKYRLVGILTEPETLHNMGSPDRVVDPTPPRIPSQNRNSTNLPSTLEEVSTLIDDFSTGYYNENLGDIYPGNPNRILASYFLGPNQSTGDPSTRFSIGPNLITVTQLGNWLFNPEAALKNGFWNKLPTIPKTWSANNETAIVYEVDGGKYGINSLTGNFGVDNGIFVWVNGVYKFGATDVGTADAYEYGNIPLGNLKSGKNYIQVVRADHGVSNGYTVKITGIYNTKSN